MNYGNLLKAHIDKYLGAVPSAVVVEERLGITVATFDNVPSHGLVTSTTIGLSGHILNQPASGRAIRQELMVCVDRKYRMLSWSEVLLSAAEIVLARHTAIMLGEVLGPFGPLFREVEWCNAAALLAAPPAFFDEDFCNVDFSDAPGVIVELIPITTAEANWVRRNGWSAFFDRANEGEIDIMDLRRS